MNVCHVNPNQNIKKIRPAYMISSFDDKSAGAVVKKCFDDPNRAFTHVLKNMVGPIRYKRNTKYKQRTGYKSNRNEKKRISATNIIDPGKPKKTSKFASATKNSFGHK